MSISSPKSTATWLSAKILIKIHTLSTDSAILIWILIDNLSVSGPVQGPQKMQHIVDKTRDVMNSFIKAMEELAILRENLARTEVNVYIVVAYFPYCSYSLVF